MHVSLVIPAKGKSERLRNKNLRRIHGKTLVRLACEKALRCQNVNAVYLDTESESIISDVEDLIPKGLKILRRPKELANNSIGANEMMIYALHMMEETDLIVQTFATSPLIKHQTIDRLIETFLNTHAGNYDSFFSVVEEREYYWKNGQALNFSIDELPNSFELDPMYKETHGCYGIFTRDLIRVKRRVGEKPMLIEIPLIESLDINTADDFDLLKKVYEV